VIQFLISENMTETGLPIKNEAKNIIIRLVQITGEPLLTKATMVLGILLRYIKGFYTKEYN
jgi:hypothetical protein